MAAPGKRLVRSGWHFLFLVACLLDGSFLFGQAAGGSLSGTVRDQSGAAVPLTGPGLAVIDLSLSKNLGLPFLGEEGGLQFRGELFNLLNRANFRDPARAAFNHAGVLSPMLGRIDSVRSSAPEIQLGLRLVF